MLDVTLEESTSECKKALVSSSKLLEFIKTFGLRSLPVVALRFLFALPADIGLCIKGLLEKLFVFEPS